MVVELGESEGVFGLKCNHNRDSPKKGYSGKQKNTQSSVDVNKNLLYTNNK